MTNYVIWPVNRKLMPADLITLPTEALLPKNWLRAGTLPNLRVYNPAITRFRGRLLMAYRVDTGRGPTTRRRIGLCELDEQLQVIPGSVSPLSDTIRGGDNLHYDPRFLVYRNRLFIHYNNNRQTCPNQIFLVELDPDTLTARAPAQLLQLDGPRRDIEKNWMFFGYEGDLFAVYTIAPHVILQVGLTGTGTVSCRPVFNVDWDVSAYAALYGEPRGGTPPQQQGNMYVSFFHSLYPVSRLRWVLRFWPIAPNTKLPRYLAAINRRLRKPFGQVRYAAGAYAFEAAPPFRPVWLTPAPILRPEDEPPRVYRQRANPYAHGIVYPCGAIPRPDQRWLVSYGLHDEQCCLRFVSLLDKPVSTDE
jgi:hypothetical protein